MRLPRVKLSPDASSPVQLFVIGPIIGLAVAAALLLGLVLVLPHPVSTASAQVSNLWCGDGICSPENGEQYYNCADCLSSCNWCTDQAFCESIQPEEEWFFVPGFSGCSTQGCCIHIPPPDGTPPVTTAILDGTQGLNGWYVSPVTVTLVATDNQSGVFSTNLDGEPYTGPRVYDIEGATTIVYQSYDNAGNLEELKSTTFYIDTIPPASTVVVPAESGKWFHGELMIAGTSTDATSGVGGVEISLDGGTTWQPATGGEIWAFTWNTRNYGDGLYGVRVRGTDQAGNVETPVSIDIGVDNSGPFFDVGPFPGEHCFSCSGPLTFTLTAFDDQSHIANTAVVVKKDGKDMRVLKAPNGDLRGVPVVWDGKDDSGQPVPAGDYQLLFYTANQAGLFGSYGAGIRVVDALPAAPVPAPLAPVDPPEHTPWIMTPIPPTSVPFVPPSGVTGGEVSFSSQQSVAPQTNTSNTSSLAASATDDVAGKNNGAAATGLAALLVAAGAYIAARQTMGDKSLAQKLAELAGAWKPASKPVAPPVPKVAPPKAPPPPPPAPPRPKALRWNEIPHTPPAPPPPPKPAYYPPAPAVSTKQKATRGRPIDVAVPSTSSRPSVWSKLFQSAKGAVSAAKQPARSSGLRGGALAGAVAGSSRSTQPKSQPKPQTPAKPGGLFGGLMSAVQKVTTAVSNNPIVKTVTHAAAGIAKTVRNAVTPPRSTFVPSHIPGLGGGGAGGLHATGVGGFRPGKTSNQKAQDGPPDPWKLLKDAWNSATSAVGTFFGNVAQTVKNIFSPSPSTSKQVKPTASATAMPTKTPAPTRTPTPTRTPAPTAIPTLTPAMQLRLNTVKTMQYYARWDGETTNKERYWNRYNTWNTAACWKAPGCYEPKLGTECAAYLSWIMKEAGFPMDAGIGPKGKHVSPQDAQAWYYDDRPGSGTGSTPFTMVERLFTYWSNGDLLSNYMWGADRITWSSGRGGTVVQEKDFATQLQPGDLIFPHSKTEGWYHVVMAVDVKPETGEVWAGSLLEGPKYIYNVVNPPTLADEGFRRPTADDLDLFVGVHLPYEEAIP